MTNSLTPPAESAYQHSLDDPLATIDPYADLLIRLEEKRQHDKIILIPSESIASQAVRQALGSVFTNLYAEGYPATRTQRDEVPQLMECDRQLACHRRYADPAPVLRRGEGSQQQKADRRHDEHDLQGSADT